MEGRFPLHKPFPAGTRKNLKKKLLLCGASGFVGKNILKSLVKNNEWDLHAVYHRAQVPSEVAKNKKIKIVSADLTRPADVERAIAGMDAVIQAAATTSGAKDIVSRPHIHIADNAIMNALIFRAAHDHKVKRLIFFSCTIMYAEQSRPVKETDFSHAITEKYFGAGWTKVYNEKMCEFYSRIGPTKYTAIRHSNVYGPHDKYDPEKSHVFGATLAKVMKARDGKIVVWGDGSEERDLLYIDDLVDFVNAALSKQTTPFELVNAGSGRSISVAELTKKIISISGKNLKIEFDKSKPTIPFRLTVDCSRAKRLFGWAPKTSLEDGIKNSLSWYRKCIMTHKAKSC